MVADAGSKGRATPRTGRPSQNLPAVKTTRSELSSRSRQEARQRLSAARLAGRQRKTSDSDKDVQIFVSWPSALLVYLRQVLPVIACKAVIGEEVLGIHVHSDIPPPKFYSQHLSHVTQSPLEAEKWIAYDVCVRIVRFWLLTKCLKKKRLPMQY